MDLCLKLRIPFIEICLGFVYASKKLLTALIELKIIQRDKIEDVNTILDKIVDSDIEGKRELIDILNKFLEEKENE